MKKVPGLWPTKIIIALLLAGLSLGCEPDAVSNNPAIDKVFGSLNGAGVRGHMEILAADEMQGREAGTEGHRKAAEYVASQFSEFGLQPIGDNGTYFQHVNFLETRLIEGSTSMVLHLGETDTALEYGVDYVRYGGFGAVAESVTAPLVFVGFGIRAPGYDHDDFAGVDVVGKILVEFTGAPPTFAANERAFYSSGSSKQALASKLGAVGIITIRTPVDQERLTWPRMLSFAKSADMRWLDSGNNAQDGFVKLTGNAVLSNSGAEQLFALVGKGLNALFEHHISGATGSFGLDVSATLSRESIQRRTTSPNVLALLPGRDPDLRNEYVLVTAHLDHLGVLPGEGDEIHNGAYDNAAGVATVLELAGALPGISPAPRRSIVFAAVTGEEKGLRGSDYLAHNPPFAIENIVANINIDMPYFGHPMADIEGFGVEHSTLHGALMRATEQQNIALTSDPRPELVRLIRSDQFSFVKRGVPGLNLKPGSSSLVPEINGAEMRSAFLREHYHSPSDDLNLPFSEEGARRFAKVALALVLIVANDDQRPRWKKGDFFGKQFAVDTPR